ncbi:MAG: hypothetical protein V8S22_05975 [Lachnospiraceae bacterium]
MEICVRTGEKNLRLSDESYGTLSQVHFAARMAIGKTLSDREPMPVVLDDTFSMYDPERLLAVFRWLKKCGSQVILFSPAVFWKQRQRKKWKKNKKNGKKAVTGRLSYRFLLFTDCDLLRTC